MAVSSQNSVSPSLLSREEYPGRTYSFHADSSVNGPGEDLSEHQDSRQQDIPSDVDKELETGNNFREEGHQSTNARDTREDNNYGDDEKAGSGVETDSVDYGGESELLREGVRDGSVSPSYSSLRVEPDLEDSQSHLRLEEIFEGDGNSTASDVDLSEPFAISELELIERALQSLQKSQKLGRQESRDSIDGETGHWNVELDERSPQSPNYTEDDPGVSRLLKKVQAVRAQKRDEFVIRRSDNNRSPRPRSLSPTRDQDLYFADMRQVVQAASTAALSAAKAAEAMVNSMDRNSQAIEELCKTLTCTTSEETSLKRKEDAGFEDNEDSNTQLMRLQEQELDIELRQTEIAKSLVRQNKFTHWVLGFMIVSSFAWRFGVVKFVRKVNNAVSNPFQGIRGVFDNMKGNQSAGSKVVKGKKGLKLPSIIPGESDDNKDDDELPFNLGKILPQTGTNNQDHGSSSACGESSQNNKDRHLNIGKILTGRGDSTDEEQ